ncbi:MAG: UbiA prenyltransferase family protein [Planctomycetaceae bacterium]|nr:UbiA prenyltransferase family protein [Planctomycetaceae bacterium]
MIVVITDADFSKPSYIVSQAPSFFPSRANFMTHPEYTTGTSTLARRNLYSAIAPYVSIARPDHWFKNVFMLAGIVLAWFYHHGQLQSFHPSAVLWAIASVCLVASSYYVLNEILDAPSDRDHPVKCRRPIPSGLVSVPLAYVEWLSLGILGLVLAWQVNPSFFWVAVVLWCMGLIYNVPPLRTKEVPYLDVLSESVNNPLRLALGWFVVSTSVIPPASLLASYWMIGAFFMASKRFAEYRTLADKQRASAYRSSFRYYDENRLLVSMFFYVSAAALLLGVFIIRYHLELILSVPLIAGFFAYYLHIALRENSCVQNPERLYRETGLMAYLVICVVSFLGLMFVQIPALYEVFNVEPSSVPPLWKL